MHILIKRLKIDKKMLSYMITISLHFKFTANVLIYQSALLNPSAYEMIFFDIRTF